MNIVIGVYRTIVPAFVRAWLGKIMKRARRLTRYAGGRRYCPICGGVSGEFDNYGLSREKDQCFHCGSLGRHRLLWLFLAMKNCLASDCVTGGGRVLHIAAEECLEKHFRKRFGDGYITADLYDPRAMVKMDITNIPYEDESVDIIFCNHVLEHVSDDQKAMREMCRVLKKTGFAVLMTPVFVDMETTYEDPSITTEKERERAFGQGDHVRKYGRDYVDRLRRAGFSVEAFGPEDVADSGDIIRMGLRDTVYYCVKGSP
jgi:SAM-dependent methyltransferase